MTKINELPISVSSVVTLHFYLSTSVPCYPMPHSGFKLLNYKPYTAFSVCCTICCDSELPPYSTVCLFAFQQTAIIGALKTIPYILLFLTPLRTPLKSRYHTGNMVQILVPLSKIGCLTTAQTHGCASDNGGLAAQALNVRILHISRDQKPVHNKTSSTLLSFFQRSLLLRQSRTALVLRIFSSFLLQDLLLHPSDPHHWFTGMPLLHIRAHVLEVMNLMKTLNMDSCVRRRYASVRHVMCQEFIGSISA
ncbi:hypothetical protein T03_5259 [Trichinella britovi]|uniref:Uncharacterized protein n=1 Tax=Trichinella britovi TaxID=45882 RepID=A0A0V1C7K0_TRIBR|nr:hypothetical protein T03_5259 [Trichinella britovi]